MAISKTPLFFALVLPFAAIPSAHAQIVKKGDAYLMRQKYTKGQVIRYSLTTKTAPIGGAKPITIPLSMKLTVLEVKGNVATLKTSVDPIKGLTQKTQESTVKVDTTGKIVGGVQSQQMSAMNSMSVLPKKAVKVGESWTQTVAMPVPGLGNLSVRTIYKFQGVKSVGGRQVAVLGLNLVGASQSFSMKGSGTSQMLLSDGSTVALSMNQTLTIRGAQGAKPMTLAVTTTMTRK